MSTFTFNMGYTTYNVDVAPKKSITITREGHEPNKFEIGDMAEFDSWNLSYYGEIVSITDKTVTINTQRGDKKVRLKLESFAWRNYNFKLDEVIAKNSDTMMYI